MSDLHSTEFSADELDAAAELFNMGMGRAAKSLSRMVDEEVLLSVPVVRLMRRSELEEQLRSEGVTDIASVTQDFQGRFSGSALLIFPRAESLALARAMVRSDIELDQLPEMEQDVVTEVGNVLLNACLAALAKMLGGEFLASSPTFRQGEVIKVLEPDGDPQQDILLFAEVRFSLQHSNLSGMVVFALPVRSLDDFRSALDRLLA